MKHLSGDQIKSLVLAAPEKHRLMILVAFMHGLRASETLSLRGRNIKGGYLQVQRLKGSKKTTQPFVFHKDPDLSEGERLLALSKIVGENQVLFPIGRQHFWTIMKQAGEAAGIPSHLCFPHVLKHSLAMALIKTKPIHEVQVVLGHKSIASTGAYLQVSEQEACKGMESCI